MSDHDRSAPANTHLARHLARGAIGFGLTGSALALTPSAGPAALLLALPGMIALRGCPMCWIAGLIQVISAGRLERTCTDDSCTLHPSDSPTARALRGRAPQPESARRAAAKVKTPAPERAIPPVIV
jgi:hypothetical protein